MTVGLASAGLFPCHAASIRPRNGSWIIHDHDHVPSDQELRNTASSVAHGHNLQSPLIGISDVAVPTVRLWCLALEESSSIPE